MIVRTIYVVVACCIFSCRSDELTGVGPEEPPDTNTLVDEIDWPLQATKVIAGLKVVDEKKEVACEGVFVSTVVDYKTNSVRLLTDAPDVYPGQIVSYKSLLGRWPREIIVKKDSIEVFIDGLQILNNSLWVQNPNQANVSKAHARLIRENLGDQWLAARLFYYESIVHDYKQATMELNTTSNFLDLTGDWTVSQTDSTYTTVLLIEQAFYDFKLNRHSARPEDYLQDVNGAEMLSQIDPDDQFALITHVTYGRLIAVTITTSKSAVTDNKKITSAWKNFLTGNISDDETRIIENSKIEALVYGGDLEPLKRIVNRQDLLSAFQTGTSWSPTTTPGLPIAYRAVHFADGMQEMVFGRTTEFTIEEFLLSKGDFLYDTKIIAKDIRHEQTPVDLCGGDWGCDWRENGLVGGTDELGGLGSLSFGVGQDHAVLATTWVYNRFERIVNLEFESGTVPRVWVDEKEYRISPGSPRSKATLRLPSGWAKLQISDGRQHGSGDLKVMSIANQVDIMDSRGCVK